MLLAAMGRITGLESTYMTEIHWERFEQEIRYARNTGDLHVPEGLLVEWAAVLGLRPRRGAGATSRELESAVPFEVLDDVEETQVPLLDEVEQRNLGCLIPAGKS